MVDLRVWLPAVAFLALTAVLAAGGLLDIDIAVRDWCDAHRPEVPRLVARLLNFGGSANLLAAVSLTLASILAIRRHTGRPLIPVLLTLAVSYVVVVPLKVVADRAAPHSIRPHAVELFANDAGWSYPSGHVVNTLIWYPLMVLLLTELRPRENYAVLLVVPPIVVGATATYLGFHWFTDVVAGLLLGLALKHLLVNERLVRGTLSSTVDQRRTK